MEINELKILQWNFRSIDKKRTAPFAKTVDNHNIICQESWLNDKRLFDITNFNTVRIYRIAAKHGESILFAIRKDIHYTELNNVRHQRILDDRYSNMQHD